jgi:arylsulfatase A-like enzyme
METHLPYRPPARFARRLAPYLEDDEEAQSFIRDYNMEHYRWMIPLTEPLGELEDRVLNDLYDAEVAYEDRLLRRLLKDLGKPGVRENTMVIITSDHGEGLNHHHFVGHSLVAYDDLVRVPLIIRYPRQYPAGKRVSSLISARRVFHSVLDATAIQPNDDGARQAPNDVENLTLTRALNGSKPGEETIFAEAYTPDTLLALMENQTPDAIDYFRCRSMRRAAYNGRHKLITVGGEPDELFDVINDPGETKNLLGEKPKKVAELQAALRRFTRDAEARRPANWESARKVSLDDEEISERLRALGYIE